MVGVILAPNLLTQMFGKMILTKEEQKEFDEALEEFEANKKLAKQQLIGQLFDKFEGRRNLKEFEKQTPLICGVMERIIGGPWISRG